MQAGALPTPLYLSMVNASCSNDAFFNRSILNLVTPCSCENNIHLARNACAKAHTQVCTCLLRPAEQPALTNKSRYDNFLHSFSICLGIPRSQLVYVLRHSLQMNLSETNTFYAVTFAMCCYLLLFITAVLS